MPHAANMLSIAVVMEEHRPLVASGTVRHSEQLLTTGTCPLPFNPLHSNPCCHAAPSNCAAEAFRHGKRQLRTHE
jgi:hypothetical protein